MVLHQNKWDRKATRAHFRKLKANEPPSQETAPNSNESTNGLNQSDAIEADATAPGDSVETPAQEPSKKDVAEKEHTNHFTKRKVESNVWRYEEEEPEFPLVKNIEEKEFEPEPEPDYVSLTRGRENQVRNLDRESAEASLIDEEFLRDRTWQQRGTVESTANKGKVVKVDKQGFQEINTKISKQANVDAFKARFGSRKATRVPRPGLDFDTKEEDDQNAPGLDLFLQDLDSQLKGKIIAPAPISQKSEAISQDCGDSTIRDEHEVDKNEHEDWLDSMLGIPRRR